eukprot:764534-Hanusia_phi.AAC.2
MANFMKLRSFRTSTCSTDDSVRAFVNYTLKCESRTLTRFSTFIKPVILSDWSERGCCPPLLKVVDDRYSYSAAQNYSGMSSSPDSLTSSDCHSASSCSPKKAAIE